jgi:exonuclease SbcC
VRIRKLTLAGFGPYKNEQVVDFERFEDAGLFLITGKTGAGKSSILDAICFALYGSVPRYDGTQAQLRSDHCDLDDPTFVELEFTVGGVDYSVRRSPEYERPKKGRAGTTRQAHDASLSRHAPGQPVEVVAARPVDVAHEINRIVALTKEQFLQVVLLAQNRFQQFLLARNDDRQAVLRTLFGSRRFEQIEVALDDKRKALQAEVSAADGVLDQLVAQAAALLEEETPAWADAAWFEAGVARLAVLGSAAAERAAHANLAFEAADAEHRALLDMRTLQNRRNAASEVIATLDERSPEVETDRITLDGARRAAPVWPLAVALESAESELAKARTAEDAARAAFAGIDEATPLPEFIDGIAATLGALTDVLADERRLPDLEADIERLSTSLADSDVALDKTTGKAATLPAEISAVAALVTDAAVRAARAEEAAHALERITGARYAARSASGFEARLDAANATEKHASSAHTAAAVRLDALLEQRLNGHAAELAAALVEGEPCSVCGSTSHPAPASNDDAPVTGEDIEEARDLVAQLRREMDAAHAAVVAATTGLVEARVRAEGKSLDDLEAELAAAEAALASAREAERQLRELEARRDAMRAEAASVEATLEELRSLRLEATRLLGESTTRRDDILARTTAHRGAAASVTERVAQLTRQLRLARALDEATGSTEVRRSAWEAARASLLEQLGEHAFDDADEARRAHRTRVEVADLEARIRHHDEARATAEAMLDEPGVAEVPEHPVDVEPARLARELALGDRDEARDASMSIIMRLERLEAVAAQAEEQRAITGHRRAEFEQLRVLASVVRGDDPNTRRMRLETYVLAAQLEEIVAAANTRLRTMSAGRYALEHDDALQYRNAKSGLGLAIRDEHTGRSRPTHSLSGGETFLASLALALGLAEVVTNQAGGITLDTLFIDEGFGSLDADTLEIAMSTLDGLRTGGRTIGLISHVEAMKEQIPAKLRITVSPQGHSSIQESHDGSPTACR